MASSVIVLENVLFDLDPHGSSYIAQGKKADQNMPKNAGQEFND